MKIIKQVIDMDAVQRNRRRNNNDNRGKMQHTARAATTTTTNNQKKCKYCGKQHLPKQCPAFDQTCKKCGKKNHRVNYCNSRIIRENQTTEDYSIEVVTKEVGKKTVKAEVQKVQNEVKKIRNREERANEKMKKNKQQLDDDGSVEKNKEKLYDDRTAINKKQQVDSMARGDDVQKRGGMLVMKMSSGALGTGAKVNVMPTREFSQIANTEGIEQNKVKLKGYEGSAIPVIGESFIRCAYSNIYKDVKFYMVKSSSKTALGLELCQDFKLIKIMEEMEHSGSGKVQEDADSKKLETKVRSVKELSAKALKK